MLRTALASPQVDVVKTGAQVHLLGGMTLLIFALASLRTLTTSAPGVPHPPCSTRAAAKLLDHMLPHLRRTCGADAEGLFDALGQAWSLQARHLPQLHVVPRYTLLGTTTTHTLKRVRALKCEAAACNPFPLHKRDFAQVLFGARRNNEIITPADAHMLAFCGAYAQHIVQKHPTPDVHLDMLDGTPVSCGCCEDSEHTIENTVRRMHTAVRMCAASENASCHALTALTNVWQWRAGGAKVHGWREGTSEARNLFNHVKAVRPSLCTCCVMCACTNTRASFASGQDLHMAIPGADEVMWAMLLSPPTHRMTLSDKWTLIQAHRISAAMLRSRKGLTNPYGPLLYLKESTWTPLDARKRVAADAHIDWKHSVAKIPDEWTIAVTRHAMDRR